MTEAATEAKRVAALIRQMVGRIYVGSKAMAKRFGLTGPQVVALRTLLAHGSMPAARLAEFMYVTPSNLTGITDRLEVKGLIARTRQHSDRRVTLLTLTDEGKRQAEQLADPIEERVAAGLARLEREEVEAIRAALERLVGFLGESGSRDPEPAPLHSPEGQP